jgi:hypothetical protein
MALASFDVCIQGITTNNKRNSNRDNNINSKLIFQNQQGETKMMM